MELMPIVLGLVVLVLACGLWVWWRDGRTSQPFCDRVCHRLRSVLQVVSRDEMKVMQERLQHMEQQWESRVARLEATTKFSNQLQYASKEIDRRLTQLEMPEGPRKSSETGSVQRPRSIVRLGVRLTLSDVLWTHLGITRGENIEDHLIDALIQGPFCSVCLKRLVGREQAKRSTKVSAQCRHCGISWNRQGTFDHPIALVDLKRQVYDLLDQEYRANGTIQPYEY